MKYNFTYYFYEEKVKFISDETLTIKARLLYLSAILLFSSFFIEFQITAVFGIKFKGTQHIDMYFVVIFMMMCVLYNFFSFLHKFSEDRLSNEKIENNHAKKGVNYSEAKGELIKSQTFDFKGIEKYKPPKISEYNEVLEGFTDEIDQKIKHSLFENTKEFNFEGLSQSEHEQIRNIGSITEEDIDLIREIIKKHVSISKQNIIMLSIKENIDTELADLKLKCLKKLDTCLDPAIFTEDIKSLENKFEKNISEFKKALEKRAVKLGMKKIINFYIPVIFSCACFIYSIYKLLQIANDVFLV